MENICDRQNFSCISIVTLTFFQCLIAENSVPQVIDKCGALLYCYFQKVLSF